MRQNMSYLGQFDRLSILLDKTRRNFLFACAIRFKIHDTVQKVRELVRMTNGLGGVVIVLEDVVQQHLTLPQARLVLTTPYIQALVVRFQALDEILRSLE